jgi:hypothetical protein
VSLRQRAVSAALRVSGQTTKRTNDTGASAKAVACAPEDMHTYKSFSFFIALPLLFMALLPNAQGSDLSVSPAVISGGTATLGIPLTITDTAPAGLEWKVAYSPSEISSLSVTSGPSAASAVKTISCSSGSGPTTCLLAGLNANNMASGVVAYLNATIAPGVTQASIQISDPVASDSSGNGIDMTTSVNSRTINVTSTGGTGGPLSGLSCNPASIGPGAVSACTVTLSQAAPANGSGVTLSSNNNSLTVPASVTVAAGSSNANFNATAAGDIGSNQTATVTATLGGASQTASINLVAPSTPSTPTGSVVVSSIACNPYILGQNADSTCTVTLSSAAGGDGAAVTLQSNNTAFPVPASVTVPAGAATASFAARAGTFHFSQTAIVTAALNGATATTSLTLMRRNQ